MSLVYLYLLTLPWACKSYLFIVAILLAFILTFFLHFTSASCLSTVLSVPNDKSKKEFPKNKIDRFFLFLFPRSNK